MLHVVKLIERRRPQRSRTIVSALLALAALALLAGLALAVH